MGSPAAVTVVGGPAIVATSTMELLQVLEAQWSRFLPDSEISRLNRADGAWVDVSPATLHLLTTASMATAWSGGAFDPTMLRQLELLGYDRDFASVISQDDVGGAATSSDAVRSRAGTRSRGTGIEVDADSTRARLASGIAFDPGGIGKGLAADLACAHALALGAEGAMVNLGGDLRVSGASPHGGGWTVDALHPPTSIEVLRIVIEDGAVATSSPMLRRWTVDGEARHHILDPTDGLPASTSVLAVTVVAATGWQAEVLCKVALLARSVDVACEAVQRTGAHLVATTIDHEVVSTVPTWEPAT